MSSPSETISAAPWRGAAAGHAPVAARERKPASPGLVQWRVHGGPARDLVRGTGLLALWIVLWSFFILAVATPAAQVHRSSASLPAAAVAAAGEPCSDGSR
jgi:hypothetical protein